MKPIYKGDEPLALTAYRQAVPQSTWNQMRDDLQFQGQQAYKNCRETTITDQKGLCAYCEIDIRVNASLQCRVEHFHPKSDHSTAHNWALDWANMLGVCNGGSNEHVKSPGFFLEPLDENLSCDAHKDRMIQQHQLNDNCDGLILNPIHLVAFPSLFKLDKSFGEIHANTISCADVTITGNQHQTTANLVNHSIKMLNLNCDRLVKERLRVIRDIEHNKKLQRQQGYTSQQGLANLIARYFQMQWPAFFTTIRLCLGEAAEEHLQALQFHG